MPMSNVDELQMVKSWMKEYGYYILFSIIVFLLASFSWRYWQQYKYNKLEHTTMLYSQMLDAANQKKNEQMKLFGEKLVNDYAKSIYASLAALMLAKYHVESDYLKSAEEKLQFVIKNSPSKELRDLARVRMARVLIAMGTPQRALDLLTVKKDQGFYAAEIFEVRGDALLKLGRTTEALEAFRNARLTSQDLELTSPLLKMKIQQF